MQWIPFRKLKFRSLDFWWAIGREMACICNTCLNHDGAEVSIGQVLSKGQLVGYSGSTALAVFPYLHLVATIGNSWQYPYTSFPTTFSNTRKNEVSLKKGEAYSALPYL